MQPGQDSACPVSVVEQEFLGDLERQDRRLQTAGGDHGADPVRQFHVDQGTGRQVHGDGQRLPLRLPVDGLIQCLPQNDLGQGVHQPRLLDDRDELIRRQQAALGVVPPHEGLDVPHRSGGQVDLRLVVQDQLLVGEREPKFFQGAEPDLAVAVVFAVVHSMAVAARFRLVHRHVGFAQQRGQIVALVGMEGYSDTGAGLQGDALQQERFGQGRTQFDGDCQGVLPRGVREEDRELVSAEPGQQVPGTQLPVQADADLNQ